jgi:molybdate transport system ATP-binding protein
VPGAPGARLRLRILARDVMLSGPRPEGLSALNILPATIEEIRLGEGPGALVQLRAGGALILARITRRSVLGMGLAPGQAVHAVIKAVSVAQGDVGRTG